jgi:hypothetical protein
MRRDEMLRGGLVVGGAPVKRCVQIGVRRGRKGRGAGGGVVAALTHTMAIAAEASLSVALPDPLASLWMPLCTSSSSRARSEAGRPRDSHALRILSQLACHIWAGAAARGERSVCAHKWPKGVGLGAWCTLSFLTAGAMSEPKSSHTEVATAHALSSGSTAIALSSATPPPPVGVVGAASGSRARHARVTACKLECGPSLTGSGGALAGCCSGAEAGSAPNSSSTSATTGCSGKLASLGAETAASLVLSLPRCIALFTCTSEPRCTSEQRRHSAQQQRNDVLWLMGGG